MLSQQDIVDAAAEHNLAPSEYFSLWHDLASWQLDTLKHFGLRPQHRLLDVGCGAMRLGLDAVDYLEDGNYFGVDAFEPYIFLAQDLVKRAGLNKRFTVIVESQFRFGQFGVKFDFTILQSVFTHLSPSQCEACVTALRGVMAPGGICLFTYSVGVSETQGILYSGRQPMQLPAVRNVEWFERLGADHGAFFETLDVSHPTGQGVACYRW